MKIKLASGAFQDGQTIPTQHTADGTDTSPPLKWENQPDRTKSLALICEDPDAPGKTWIHWVIFNIPPETRELNEGVLPQEVLPGGALQGTNDFGNVGYGGPSPPRGKPHRYFFRLYALDKQLELPAARPETNSAPR